MKPIPDFPDYLCDIHGNIYSMRPSGNSKLKRTQPVKLKPYQKSNGYLQVDLLIAKGERRKKYVHRLVLETFVGSSGDRLDCNHKDGNKTNNNLENLEWVTKSQNMLHSARVLGNKPGLGEDSMCNKINNNTVRFIRWARGRGIKYNAIAELTKMDESWVYRIAVRKAWAHVE